AISRGRRLLLPRSGVARSRRHARADRTRHCARRNPTQGPGAISANHGGARADRRDLAEPFQQTCATGRPRNVSGASRSDFWRTEDDMTSSRTITILAALALSTVLAGCNERKDPGFQGWVEADMIFVSPDERGRDIKLNVREGDEVQPGAQLYSDDDHMQPGFFVPETELPKLAIGDEVKVTCDNCAADLTAKIYFIATTAEYTPPVIYSLDERNKLVYLIQARPSRPDTLRVGQPISVFLNPRTPVADKR